MNKDLHFLTYAEASEFLRAKGYRLHSSAMHRGYICAKWSAAYPYEGRYGKGYALHCANAWDNYRSRSFHRVEYWLINS